MTEGIQTPLPRCEGDWLTIRQAADRLGLPPKTIHRLISGGRFRAEDVTRLCYADKTTTRRTFVAAAAIEQYRADHLGKRSWARRRDPDYQPSPGALAARRYRERKRACAGQQAGDETLPQAGNT